MYNSLTTYFTYIMMYYLRQTLICSLSTNSAACQLSAQPDGDGVTSDKRIQIQINSVGKSVLTSSMRVTHYGVLNNLNI